MSISLCCLSKLITAINLHSSAVNPEEQERAPSYCSCRLLVAEAYLGVSGVVSVVVLGVTLNNERTCVSPEVETFLHR